MTPEWTDDQLRVAIGIWTGRKLGQYFCAKCEKCIPIDEVSSGGYHQNDECCSEVSRTFPNYPQSLDAIALVEDKLSIGQTLIFAEKVLQICNPNSGTPTKRWGINQLARSVRASARQRCLAIVATLGLQVSSC